MRRLPGPLLAISPGDARVDSGSAVLDDWLDRLADAGVGAVQLREKTLDDRALFELAHHARRRLPAEILLLVNGRVDLALAAGADGVHLPADGVPVAAIRRRFGRQLWIGVSTHTTAEVVAAEDDGADYAVFGPVYPTPSKAAYGPPPGLDGLRHAGQGALPVYALGGVTAERFAEVAAAGAAGAAGIRMFQEDVDALTALARQARVFDAVAVGSGEGEAR